MSENGNFNNEFRPYKRSCAAIYRKMWEAIGSLGHTSEQIETLKTPLRPILDEHFKGVEFDYWDEIDDNGKVIDTGAKSNFLADLSETLVELGFSKVKIKIIERAIDEQLSYEFNPTHEQDYNDDDY